MAFVLFLFFFFSNADLEYLGLCEFPFYYDFFLKEGFISLGGREREDTSVWGQ